jgi:hypothetical protein
VRRSTGIALAAVACVSLGVLLVPAALGGLRPNPANDPRLLNKPIEAFHYDYAHHCGHHPKPGTLALQHWLERNVRGQSWGIMRCERLSAHNFSLHSVGRALDWHLDAGNPKDRRAALRLIHTLIEPDKHGNPAALARRMGVQGLIFNCRAWWSSPGGLVPYSYCYKANGRRRHHLDRTQAHKNHVHIELNTRGAAKKTSFWRSALARR